MSDTRRLTRAVKRQKVATRIFQVNPLAWQLIIEDFLTLYDLSALDIALCNHQLRPLFLSILSDCILGRNSSEGFKYLINESCLQWLHKRKITKIHAANFLIDSTNVLESFPLEWSFMRRFESSTFCSNSAEPLGGPWEPYFATDFSTIIDHLCNLEEFSIPTKEGDESLHSWSIEALTECCPKLQKLQCTLRFYNEYMDLLQKLAEQCHYLKELSIFMNEAPPDESIVLLLSHCNNLECFELKYAEEDIFVPDAMSDEVLASIAVSCPRLRKISYQSDSLGAGMIKLTESCKSLTSFEVSVLGIDGEEEMTTEDVNLALTALTSNCPLLEKFSMDVRALECNIDCYSIISLARSCANLIHLSFKCGNFDAQNGDDELVGLASACQQLQYLSLSEFRKLDISMIEIAHNCHSLGVLKLDTCYLSNNALIAISMFSKNLKEVEFRSISGCYQDDDEYLDNVSSRIGTQWNALESFLVDGHRDFITDSCIRNIAKYCPNLRTLYWSSYGAIFDEIHVVALSQHCRNLESLHLEYMSQGAVMKLPSVFAANRKLKYNQENFTVGYSELDISCTPYHRRIKAIVANRRK